MFHNKSPTKHFGDTPVYVWMFTMCRYKKKILSTYFTMLNLFLKIMIGPFVVELWLNNVL